MKENPPMIEIARSNSANIFSIRPNGSIFDQILRAEASDGRRFNSVHDLFNDMEDKDAHLYSCLQTRKIGVLAKERKVLAASDSAADRRIAEFVKNTLAAIPFFDQALMNLLDAIAKGFSVIEIMWKLSGEGQVIIDSFKSRFAGRFTFDDNNDLRILDPSEEYIKLFGTSCSDPAAPDGGSYSALSSIPAYNLKKANPLISGYPVPSYKFLIHTFNAKNENPFGRGLCLKAYWYYWFKKNNLKFWVMFNEKFGAPTVIGKYRPGASEEERSKLLEVVESLQNDTGVTIPETVALEFLEAKRSGTVNSYIDLAEWCNNEISKLVLGQTLTSMEGQRSGSLALGKVHENVRFNYIESDAKSLAEMINSTLIKWLVDFNFPGVRNYPRFVIDTTNPDNMLEEIEIDKTLVGMGVPLPARHFYEKYKRSQPLQNERSLRYDDNNLFQYHLQYGILTINEVRGTLGLPPVEWGETPPNLPESRQANLPESAKSMRFEKGEIAEESQEEREPSLER